MTSAQAQANPFPGLRPFEASEDHLFFGRDGQSDEILRRLRRNRFLAVIGTSGSGKSSLIRAGLLPLLYGGFMMQAGSRWRVALFRPGSDPIGNLALALNASDVLGQGHDRDAPYALIAETTLRRSALGLINAVRQARMPVQENLLIVVDQFEELFRFKQSAKSEQPEDAAAAFAKLLLEAARQHELPIYIVITMRSDFLGDCAPFRDLPEAVNEGLYLIPRMTRDQRREAITGPVAVGGAQISPRLLNRLLNEVGDTPDQLPTLQHALMRTWDYWAHHHEDGERIDFRHYEAIGCMAEALSRHADEAYFELPSDHHRALAERLFKSLTEKGPDNREIRRPTRLLDLCAVTEADEAEVTAVIETFRRPSRSFLMPPVDVALGADSLIDISHESLIRGWQRLTDWVEGEALSAGIYRRVAETAVLHKEGQAGLWRDPDLQVALGWREQTRPNRAWAQRYHPQFDTAMEFLDESQSVRDTEALETERARKKNLRRVWLFTVVLGLAFVASFRLYLDANRQQKIAQEQTALAERRAHEVEAALRASEEQKVRAERKQLEAERAKQVANQEKDHAEKLTGYIRQHALRLRKLNLYEHATIVSQADKLIAYAPPQEIVLWRNIKAFSLAQMGDHERAIAELTAILKNNPANMWARLRRGYIYYFILGETEKSLMDLEIYLKSDPYSDIAHMDMAFSLGALGRYEEATVAISKAIDATEHMGVASSAGAVENDIAPEIKRATGYRTLSVDRYSFRNTIYYGLVNLQAYSGGEDFGHALIEADKHFSSLDELLYAINWAYLHLKRRPEDYGAYASLGALWERAGFQDQALRSYAKFQQEHARRQPGNTRYDNLAQFVGQRMAELYPSGGLPAEIDPKLEKADTLDIEVDALELHVHSQASERPEEQDASPTREDRESKIRRLHERLTRAIEDQPDNIRTEAEKIELLIQRANLRSMMKDYAGAREDCDTILQLAPKTSSMYFTRAIVNMNAGMPADVVTADLRKAVDLDPVNPAALVWLSRMVSKSKPDEARTLLERSITSSDRFTLPWIYYDLAQLENKSGNYEKALAELEVAIRVQSEVLEFYDERAKAEQGSKRSESEVRRNLSAGYNNAGDLRLKLDQPQAALDIYMRSLDVLVDLEKKNSSAELQHDLAVTVHKISEVIIGLGAKDKAIAFWETVMQSGHLRGQEGILRSEIQRLSNTP